MRRSATGLVVAVAGFGGATRTAEPPTLETVREGVENAPGRVRVAPRRCGARAPVAAGERGASFDLAKTTADGTAYAPATK